MFIIEVKEFLEKPKPKEPLDALNKAYSEDEFPEETTLREKNKKYYLKKILEVEPRKV